jgi:ribosomal protein S18 acetylase RimI-like enzyme
MAVEIVRVTAENAGLMDRVAVDVFDADIHPQRLAAYLREPNHFLYVAVQDGAVVGQARAMVHRHPDTVTSLYIDNLGVTPALHRQGIASQLIEALFALGKAQGCEEAWVGTEVDNRPAQGIYEKFGAKGETFTLFAYDL